MSVRGRNKKGKEMPELSAKITSQG